MRVRDVGASPRHYWRRALLVLLMVRVEDVLVLLMLMLPPGVGVLWVVMLWVVAAVGGDAPGDADAAGVAGAAPVYGVAADADGEGGVGRWCSVLRCRW